MIGIADQLAMDAVQPLVLNSEKAPPKLSVCISTYRRAAFIVETLNSILCQIEPGVEIVLVDGASPDNTPEVLAPLLSRHPFIRYFREKENSGVDCDYDKAVAYATGDYCWLMTDDDLLRPGALSRVLALLDGSHDLVVVNSEVRSADFSKLLNERFLSIHSDKEYGENDCEQFFTDTAHCLTFIGGVVVRRRIWLTRIRSEFYGTLFLHVGVIFQHPPISKIRVIADPLITIRYGNALWTSRGFEIWMFNWPQLIWSFDDFSDQAKAGVSPKEPWRQIKNLVQFRAIGAYSLSDYRRLISGRASRTALVLPLMIALMPAVLANAAGSLFCALFYRKARMTMYDLSRCNAASVVSRLAARSMGV